jgi:threonine dehydrogenase-like Zn-dependent dehydrogenase
LGAIVNKAITIKSGQTHVQRYMRPLLARIERGEFDPSFIVSHRLGLDAAPLGYEMFRNKEEECVKVVLKP